MTKKANIFQDYSSRSSSLFERIEMNNPFKEVGKGRLLLFSFLGHSEDLA